MNKNRISIVFSVVCLLLTHLFFSSCEVKKESKSEEKLLSINQTKEHAAQQRKKWLASPDGIQFTQWQNSPEGKKIKLSHDKIKTQLSRFKSMNAVVSSVTFKREGAKPNGPKYLIVEINGENYLMQFLPKEFESLKNLKVNDHIVVKSRSAGFSPNHPYLILSSDYIAQNNTILYKKAIQKNKC